VRQWQIDLSLDELVKWTQENRYVRELTCANANSMALRRFAQSHTSGSTGQCVKRSTSRYAGSRVSADEKVVSLFTVEIVGTGYVPFALKDAPISRCIHCRPERAETEHVIELQLYRAVW